MQKLKDAYSDTDSIKSIGMSEAEKMLKFFMSNEIFKMSSDFELERYQKATEMLVKCGQSGSLNYL